MHEHSYIIEERDGGMRAAVGTVPPGGAVALPSTSSLLSGALCAQLRTVLGTNTAGVFAALGVSNEIPSPLPIDLPALE